MRSLALALRLYSVTRNPGMKATAQKLLTQSAVAVSGGTIYRTVTSYLAGLTPKVSSSLNPKARLHVG